MAENGLKRSVQMHISFNQLVIKGEFRQHEIWDRQKNKMVTAVDRLTGWPRWSVFADVIGDDGRFLGEVKLVIASPQKPDVCSPDRLRLEKAQVYLPEGSTVYASAENLAVQRMKAVSGFEKVQISDVEAEKLLGEMAKEVRRDGDFDAFEGGDSK